MEMAFSVEVGSVFTGRYRLLALIGRTHSTSVFTADDLTLNRRVTVKVFDDDLTNNDDFVERFKQAAVTASTLVHPNIVATSDWACEPCCYLVTEYQAGGSLKAMLKAGRQLSAAQALVVGLEAARALDYLQTKGLAHSGVKPANLLFSRDGQLRLCDFGLEQALAAAGRHTADVSIYSSPEQSQGEPVTAASDVYRLVLSLGEAVTGNPPLESDPTSGIAEPAKIAGTLETAELSGTAETLGTGESAEVGEIAGSLGVSESLGIAESAEVGEIAESLGVAESTEVASSLRTSETANIAESAETAGSLETAESANFTESDKTVETTVQSADTLNGTPPYLPKSSRSPHDKDAQDADAVDDSVPVSFLDDGDTVPSPSSESSSEFDPQTLIPYADTRFGFSAALGPVWYVLGKATAPLPEDRPSAAAIAKDLVGVAGLLSRPEPLPLAGLQELGTLGVSSTSDVTDTAVRSDITGTTKMPSQYSGKELSTTGLVSVEPTSGALSLQPQPFAGTQDPGSPHPGSASGAALSPRSGIPLDVPVRRRWPGLVLSVLVVLIAAAGGVWLWFENRPEVSLVPDLVGETRANAEVKLAEHGWQIEETLVRIPGTEPGDITMTDPAPFAKIRNDATLSLYVSLGEPLVVVPDLYALSVDEATGAAAELGLEVAGETPVNDADIPEGFTVGVDVPDGVYELEKGTAVNLLVSSGPADITVPGVPASRSLIAARQELLAAGLVPIEVTELSQTVAEGLVADFRPATGTVVLPNEVVEVVISLGPSQVEMPNVVGLDVSVAVSLLEEVGFIVQRADNNEQLPVTSTFPPARQLLPYGSEVVVSTET